MRPICLCAPLLLAAAPALFENIASRAGINAPLVSGTPEKRYILESMAGGVALFDYDNDGFLDLYLANGSTIAAEKAGNNTAEDRLYRNNRDGTFTDVTRKAGLGDRRWTMGVAAADIDNDGFADLFLANWGPSRLMRNNGDGAFRDVTAESGIALDGWSSSPAFADFDRDGDLDLYVSQYLEFDINRLPRATQLCQYRGIAVQCGPRGMVPSRGRLFENLGRARFKEITRESGIAKAPPAFGLGVVWGDYDNDGDPDLYAANDSLPNYLFRNNGNKTFTEVALLSGAALSADGREQAGMGVDFGDYDNDGRLDLIVTNFSDDYTTLYRNTGRGEFSDITREAGLVQPTWPLLSWGVKFADMDNDGWLDIVMANGHVYPEVDRSGLGASYRQKPSLFRNLGNGTFRDISAAAGPAFAQAQSSRGLALGDLDNDGALDLVIANLDAPPWVIRNAGPAGNWIALKLRGSVSNRDAVGARVTLKAGGITQMREVMSGGSYQSHSDLRLHFGLGQARTVDELKIRWPNGAVQSIEAPPINRIAAIDEPGERRP